jgi:hypothetical protein
MLFLGYQKICCVFAAGLFTAGYHNITEGTGCYKQASLVN